MLRVKLYKLNHLNYKYSIKSFFKNILVRPSRFFHGKPEQQHKFALRDVDQKKPSIPATTLKAQQQMQSVEKQVNYLEKQRLKNIDQALGTRTYFYQAKIYQIKLDSEHVMMVKRMKAQMFVDKLKNPPKYDSKINQSIKLRNRKKYWKSLARMRQYPQHKTVEFNDQSSSSFLQFLAKQVLFTRMSFYNIQDVKSYFLKQDVDMKTYLLYSPKYVYYNIPKTPLLGRTLKSKFPESKIFSQIPQSDVQVIMSLDEIYNQLLKYDNNPFVEQFLKDVQNNTLKDTITQKIKWTKDENHLVILVDLTGQKKQFAIMVKNLISGKITDVIFDVGQSMGIIGNKIFFIRMDSLQVLTQLCYFDIDSKQIHLVYRQKNQSMIRFEVDINDRYLYLYREQISNPWRQKILVFGFQNQEKIVQIPTQPGYQYQVASIERGLVYCKYQKNDKGEYPPFFNNFSRQLYFIPISLKHQITTIQDERMLRKADQMKQIIKNYNEVFESKIELRQTPKQLVLSPKHEVIYKCQAGEAIESLLNMKNQIILSIIRSWNQPDYQPTSKLHVIPRKQHSSQNSLIIPDEYVSFAKVQDYSSQKVVFKLRNPLQSLFSYTTWNDELEQQCPDTIHIEYLNYETRDGRKQTISLYCQDIYKQKCLDCIILFTDENEQEVDFMTIKCLLKKGILLAVFKGRGSVYGSKQDYESGNNDNIIYAINDLIDSVLALHQSGKTTNVGLYSKGRHPSNVGAICNIMQPFLFTATVLHNGAYGFKQQQTNSKGRMYQDLQQQKQQTNQKPILLRIPALNFSGREKNAAMIQIDDISNIMISSTSNQRSESRRLIHHLRKGKKRYDQIYYREAQSNRDADLTNFCYIYRLLIDNSEQYSTLRDDYT